MPKWILPVGEWFFALLGAVICIGVAAEFASFQPDHLWPTPGLYFLELIALALLVLIGCVLDAKPGTTDYGVIPWIAVGILLAFVVLGGFTIGPFLFPAMIAFSVSAIMGDIRLGRSLRMHLVLPLVAAVGQAAVIALFLVLN